MRKEKRFLPSKSNPDLFLGKFAFRFLIPDLSPEDRSHEIRICSPPLDYLETRGR